ncbi:MAG: ABC transporter ATP-binding protein [Deltaproteobacteria bacterium]
MTAPAPSLRALLRWGVEVTGARPLHYVPTLGANFVAAALDGAAMALLVPLGDGIARGTFDEVWSRPAIAAVRSVLPFELALESWSTARSFLTLLLLIFVLLTLQALTTYAAAIAAYARDARYFLRTQGALLERYLGFGKAYFDARSSADVQTTLGYSSAILRVMGLSETLVSNVVRGAALFAVLLAISTSMTLVLLAVGPVLYIALNRLVRRVNQVADAIKVNEMETNRKVFNALTSIPLVKAYSRERSAVDDYVTLLDRRQALSLKRVKTTDIVAPLQKAIGFAALFALAGFAVWQADSGGTQELSRFCAFLLVARRALPTFEAFGQFRVALADVRPQLVRLADVLTDDDKGLVASGSEPMGPLTDAIEFRGLKFAYADGTSVFDGVSFVARAGETTALVGPSGCGKSTVASLLLRLYDCPPNQIFLDGVDIRELDLRKLRERITVVTQDVVLFHDTLRENLVFGLDDRPGDDALRQVLETVQLDALLDTLPAGLDTHLGDRGVLLSGGQRQRVSIARALLRSSDVLILDEATSALDSENERAVQDALDRVREGRTTIVIAHRLGTIRGADQILVFGEDGIVERGTHAALLAQGGRYAQMWRAQSDQG